MPSVSDRRHLFRDLPPLEAVDAAVIERFLDASWAERGLAKATLAAYRTDLEQLARWRRQGRGRSLLDAGREDLFEYLAVRGRAGYSPRSAARLLSCLHAFYRRAVREGARAEALHGDEHLDAFVGDVFDLGDELRYASLPGAGHKRNKRTYPNSI